MTALSSLSRVFGCQLALLVAWGASACQPDSNAGFDDSGLPSGSAAVAGGGTGSDNAGAGASSGGTSASGGDMPSGGNGNSGGKATGGTAGKSSGGAGGGQGKAGADMGGSMSMAGSSGSGGASAGTEMGGSAGSGGSGGPMPVTVDITNIDDASVASCNPSSNLGEMVSLDVDGDNYCEYETLIKPSLDAIPQGAQVSDATLTLTCTNAGDPITVAYVEEPWEELMVRWNHRPNDGETLDTISCDQVGTVHIDLTSAVTAWLDGDHPAYGIYLLPQGTDGTDFASSEAGKKLERPKLSVTYTLP